MSCLHKQHWHARHAVGADGDGCAKVEDEVGDRNCESKKGSQKNKQKQKPSGWFLKSPPNNLNLVLGMEGGAALL